MNDYRRQQLLEQYEDAALSLMMDRYANDDGARLLQEFEEAKARGEVPEIPPELDAKCRKLIDETFAKEQRKITFLSTAKKLSRIAACALVLLGICTVTVLSVEAIRVPVLNFLLKHTERSTSMQLSDQYHLVEESYTYEELAVLESVIPSDYEQVLQSTEEDGTHTVYYQDSVGNIFSLCISPEMGILDYNTEDVEQKTMTLLNHPAVFVDKDGYRIIWINEEKSMTYNLFSNGLDSETFWEIAYAIAE